MEDTSQDVLGTLDKLGISYTLTEHKAAFTMEDIVDQGLIQAGRVCKNLFLRDAKGKVHYLVVLPGSAKVDLVTLAEQLGSTKLSFASEERLAKYLGLTKGSVTPLGVINDREHQVVVALDRSLQGEEKLGFHPNRNTATVWMGYDDLIAYLEHFQNDLRIIRS